MQCVDISPDGKYVAAGGGSFSNPRDGKVVLWELESGKRVKTWAHHRQPVMGVSFSPDGSRLAMSSLDMDGTVCDVRGNDKRHFPGHGSGVESIQFSPDGESFVTTSYDGTMRIWDADFGESITVQSDEQPVFTAALSPDGDFVYWGGEKERLRVWSNANDADSGFIRANRQ